MGPRRFGVEDRLDTNTGKIRLFLHRASRDSHIVVGHKDGDGKPEYLWEYEAFAWARKYCVEHNIPVPARTVNYEREIIAEKLRKSLENGMKSARPVVVEFIHQKKNGDPDVKWVWQNLDADGKLVR